MTLHSDMVPHARTVAALIVAVSATAIAQPKPTTPALVGATEVAKLTAPVGFIDDPVALDDTRLAYVVADAAEKAELHVLTIATNQEQVIDLAPVTLHPIALRLVGSRAFVIGMAEDGHQAAALIELAPQGKKPAGAPVYKLGPAAEITVITRDGQPRVIVHRTSITKPGTHHEVDLVALDTGRKLASGKLDLDTAGASAQLDFKVNHWGDGMSRVFGIKGGEWNKKDDQRSPDVEAAYDVATGKFVDKHPIDDLFEQRKRFEVLAKSEGHLDFVKASWDQKGLQIWHAGKPTTAVLDQPIANYDPKSLLGNIEPDGSAWLALAVDPVNPDAVARKKADPEYFDIFHAGSDGKAERKVRILAPKSRHWFGVVGNRLWVLERSNGFDRGGKTLTLYQLQ